MSISTCGFLWGKKAGTWGHITRFGTLLRPMLINMWRSYLRTTRWPRHLLPSFPNWEFHVDTLRLFPNEWYHIAFESWVRWMHHFEHNWFELWKKLMTSLLSVYWTDGLLRMIMVTVIIFFLNIVIWVCWYFIINLPLQFCTVWLVPMMIANLHSWEQMNNSRWCWREILLLELSSRRENVGNYFGRVVFCYQLFHSWFLDSLWLGM